MLQPPCVQASCSPWYNQYACSDAGPLANRRSHHRKASSSAVPIGAMQVVNSNEEQLQPGSCYVTPEKQLRVAISSICCLSAMCAPAKWPDSSMRYGSEINLYLLARNTIHSLHSEGLQIRLVDVGKLVLLRCLEEGGGGGVPLCCEEAKLHSPQTPNTAAT